MRGKDISLLVGSMSGETWETNERYHDRVLCLISFLGMKEGVTVFELVLYGMPR